MVEEIKETDTFNYFREVINNNFKELENRIRNLEEEQKESAEDESD